MRASSAWKQLPNLASLVAVVLIAANYFYPFADLDFSWQVRTGTRIIQTGQVRTPDGFTYTIAGKQVPDFEWLYEVTLAAVWGGLGYGGLKLLRVLLVAAPLVLLARRLHREGVAWHGIALALGVAVGVLAPAWNLRPLYCTTIGLLLVSGWLHDHCTGRRPLSWWLPVVMLLWANLHPGVITGQGLLAGAIAWEWVNRRVRLNTPLSREACWRLTVIGGAGLAATFISPDPLERLLYPFRPEVAHPVQRIFAEMQPLHRFILQPPYLTNLAYVVAAAVALSVVLQFRRYRLWEVLLLLGLAGLASLAFRSLQDWLLIMLALGVPHLARLPRQIAARRRQLAAAVRWNGVVGWGERLVLRVDRSCKHVLNSALLRPQWAWPAAAVGVLAVVSLVPPLSRRMPIQDSPEWPAGALDWAETNGVSGRFFGPPDYGAYVTWRLGDRARCYTDTRGFFFTPELLEDSHYLPLMAPGWQGRLRRVLDRGTDYFLLETTGPRGELWRTLRPCAGEPLYLDDHTVLLARAQVEQAVARLHEDRVASAAAVTAPQP
ncbi:MAG TPA: hypothetical protein VJ739_16655 [Gemmataceae bacterium]|nr:hypothetical protein [Gemmataceae bacterium]